MASKYASLGVFAGAALGASLVAMRRKRRELGNDVMVIGKGGREHALAWKVS